MPRPVGSKNRTPRPLHPTGIHHQQPPPLPDLILHIELRLNEHQLLHLKESIADHLDAIEGCTYRIASIETAAAAPAPPARQARKPRSTPTPPDETGLAPETS